MIVLIRYEVGDMFLSEADCLVNTVNCEGYMGKGIAYQFKLKYPDNNKDYVKACRNGQLKIGSLHWFREDGKMIINFPTKDKWREKSKISYIETGLNKMVEVLPQLSVQTIAIPPLGCGNGGLNWNEVKAMIENKLMPIRDQYDFIIFEPSRNYIQREKQAPKLSVSALVLMQIVMGLKHFNSLRIQKAAYFMNIFLGTQYFKFQKNKFGPYAYSIEIISKKIGEYQNFYGIQNLDETYRMAYEVLCSDKINQKLAELTPAIRQSLNFVNSIEHDKMLEGVATVTYLFEQTKELTAEQVIVQFKDWSVDKAKRFSDKEIIGYIEYLEGQEMLEKNIFHKYKLI